MSIALFLKALGALFAIMNPFAMLPVFLAMTTDLDSGQQRRLGLAVAAYSALLVAAVIAGGTQVLAFFGITVEDFRVAGGIVLFMIGIGMLNGKSPSAHQGTKAEQEHQAELDSLAFYPMAFPMVVGPGTIATILVFTGHADTPAYIAVSAAAAVVLVSLAVVLFFAAQIGRVMSQSLRIITIRLMGMILAAIAVAMTVSGLKTLLPGLG